MSMFESIPFGDDTPENLPESFSMFDIDAEIRKLTESVGQHADLIRNIEVDHATKHNEILLKIEKLRLQLAEMHDKKAHALAKAQDKYREDVDRLAALRRQKAEEEANKAFEDTVILIKEICADFAAWHNAREYQVEDVVRIVHQYLIGSSGVMNANEMSLGKTFESIVALYIIRNLFEQKHGRKPNMLWLTKASIVQTGGTKNEATRWDPTLKMYPLAGSDSKPAREMVFKMAAGSGACILTNYETLRT